MCIRDRCPIRANGTACDDGNACTSNTTCTSGTCGGGSAFTCVALDTCQDPGTCDPAKASPPPLASAPGRFGLGMKFDGSSCMTRPVWDSSGNQLWPEARMFDGNFTVMAWVSPSDQYVCP